MPENLKPHAFYFFGHVYLLYMSPSSCIKSLISLHDKQPAMSFYEVNSQEALALHLKRPQLFLT